MTTKTIKEKSKPVEKPDKPYWSIKEIAIYCGVTNANIGYHINKNHITLYNERPKLVEYERNKVIIESIRIKKQGYPDESNES